MVACVPPSARSSASSRIRSSDSGVVFTAGTHGLFLQSIRTVPAHLAVLTCTLEPGYGMVAAACILGERPAPRTLLGAALIAAAVVYATLGPRSVES